MSRYKEFYNSHGMSMDHMRSRFFALPEAERFAILEEHHRRGEAIRTAYGTTGEKFNYHDRWFEPNEIFPRPTVIDEISAERKRQIEIEGWVNDDTWTKGELAEAAACYAVGKRIYGFWPWTDNWWKTTTRRRDLIKAGALIVAEIERLDRDIVNPVQS